MAAEPAIDVRSLSHGYRATRRLVFESFSLRVARAECLAILGPNGVGKTTLLNLIAGLMDPESGEISLFGEEPSLFRPGYVFQDYRATLLPWYSIGRNISLSTEATGIDDGRSTLHLATLLDELGLHQFPLRSFPSELSGGQQQIASLLRAFCSSSQLLLLDEPTSSLDTVNRWHIWQLINRFRERHQPTILLVTHDVDEAIVLGDRVLYLDDSPTQIVLDVQNAIPRPRMVEHLITAEANRIRSIIAQKGDR